MYPITPHTKHNECHPICVILPVLFVQKVFDTIVYRFIVQYLEEKEEKHFMLPLKIFIPLFLCPNKMIPKILVPSQENHLDFNSSTSRYCHRTYR
jgi:hypothetical protein